MLRRRRLVHDRSHLGEGSEGETDTSIDSYSFISISGDVCDDRHSWRLTCIRTLPQCANQRDLATDDLFGGWMIAPYNSASTVNAGIDGALKPEWTSAPCDERDEGAERRMVRVVTDIGCALCVTRASTRRFRKTFLLTSDPRHRRWCSFSSTCSVCSSRRSERVLRAYVRHGAILHPNILFLATQRARAIL